ncbi:MAG: hypothetical protein AAFW00_21750 [Bacteroidota bacterium]
MKMLHTLMFFKFSHVNKRDGSYVYEVEENHYGTSFFFIYNDGRYGINGPHERAPEALQNAIANIISSSSDSSGESGISYQR